MFVFTEEMPVLKISGEKFNFEYVLQIWKLLLVFFLTRYKFSGGSDSQDPEWKLQTRKFFLIVKVQ